MSRKQPDVLKTKRLHLRPLTDEELQAALYAAPTALEKRRFSELYAMVRLYPDYRLLCTLWEITRRSDGAKVGELHFDGPADQWGEAELHFDIFPQYRGSGYAGEALQALLDWVWKDERTYFIRFLPPDAAIAETLEKLGFVPVRGLYVKERPVKQRTRDLVSLGVSLGLLLGVFPLGDLTAGILIGAFAGFVIGGYFDAKDRRIRENLRRKG